MYYDERETFVNNENKEINIDKDINVTQNEKTWDTDMLLNIDSININNFRKDNELFTSNEGLNKGNMFKNLYSPYKNYIYKVVVKGEKDELLLKIQELTFKVLDLGLYLDVFSNDNEIYDEFKKAVIDLKKYKLMYEKNYGPLLLCETEYYNNYKWVNNPWPWVEGGKL